jgi:putative tryptophan/tyrosine transport system substrate-binding protein
MLDAGRRQFITLLLGSAAAAWPLAARAQQPNVPVVGFLHLGSAQSRRQHLVAFRQGLAETGYFEGHNVVIEYRWAEERYDRLPALAADLVQRQVAVIATPQGTPAALAAKAATSTIPIAFCVGNDPVRLGLVASLNRPGGNATGVHGFGLSLGPKRLGLIHEALPQASPIAVLRHPNSPIAESATAELHSAAAAVGKTIEIFDARNSEEIDQAFAQLVQRKAGGLIMVPDSVLTSRWIQIITQVTRHAIPAVFQGREWVEAGGLMSYGTNSLDIYRQVGVYAGRILKGAKPADLPVEQATKFEFILNLQTAKIFGVQIPPTLSARADEVIE